MNHAEKKTFLLGGYAERGVQSILQAELRDGQLSLTPVSAEAENPSWLLLHPNGQILYAVEERVPAGGLAVFRRTSDGWAAERHLPAGSAPCHLALDDEARFLFVSNYMDGTLNVWRLDAEGMPAEMTDTLRHAGHGADPRRQESPHIHSSRFLDGLLYLADLGLDQVDVCRLNRDTGKLIPLRQIAFPAGSGPRHMAVHPAHPDLLYVNAEMGGLVFAVKRETGEILQTLRVVPDDFTDPFRTSAIRFAGDTLYVPTREVNVVALMTLQADGLLSDPVLRFLRQKTPRDAWMDDSWCITADEGSFSLTLLSRRGTGLTEAQKAETPGLRPTCICPVE